ncbi:uncharacterized protein HMPREF1541_07499 [Cyphellophora europaea CBS 101466]|uniref:Btz domain-containing protein n=1 Tax=Cyphellophora europaea (strain CBS 101466) TaxID=1220924 RepID=W2RN18_CYPE1|nr:uncharacterized protein HMPREF1541_07499 [Cyphellophora europaea CBS 101466]ETN37876.1 hypothetical protein HMPREF1541_07499 [Cyphellophora europaea CBS 101466]
MAPGARRGLAPRRRRPDEEDESSVVGDVEEDSMSDGSALSLADEEAGPEASDVSEENDVPVATAPKSGASKSASTKKEYQMLPGSQTHADTHPQSEDTVSMMNGLKISDTSNAEPEIHLDEPAPEDGVESADASQPRSEAPRAPRRETAGQRARREHQEYLKQRDSDPAFVPNRGGFFLHDDRASNAQAFWNKPYGRGRGRGYNGTVPPPRTGPFNEPIDKPWSHDLHDTHESSKSLSGNQISGQMAYNLKSTAPPPTVAPNREFSFLTVLGNVTVNVSLPDMHERKAVAGLVKKQHTLLPTHRPPLRRDKPVRISIPDVEPSYRFPSTERSFIFIPRALRPNQQPYMRGRGRGSFQGSRRPSVMGSVYTPSVAMSRKSSFGGVARDNVRSPAGSNYGRPMGMEVSRPIVRLPATGMMPMHMGPMAAGDAQPFHLPYANGSVAHGVHSTAIPMYQPRPQKAVSVTNIESPVSLSVKAPQPQQEQPFHQQVPPHMAQTDDAREQQIDQSSAPGGTPLSHIPEGAVYAQPFQPYPMMQAPMYYPAPYHAQNMFYPGMTESAQGYGNGWTDGTYQIMNFAQNGPQPVQPPGAPTAPVMHMQNGMVYYTDSSMGQENQAMNGQHGMMPMGGTYGFYPVPTPMFYQPQP